jgi:hypothetical protein
MDVNKVQKLNEMALNLRKHNIGISSEESVKQAERIYGNENNFSQEVVVNHVDEIDELKKEIRKLTFGLQHATDDIKELKLLVGKLQQEVSDARIGQSSTRRHSDPQQTLGESDGTNESSERPKRDSSRPIDRNKVAPADVSVEKFFNFARR